MEPREIWFKCAHHQAIPTENRRLREEGVFQYGCKLYALDELVPLTYSIEDSTPVAVLHNGRQSRLSVNEVLTKICGRCPHHITREKWLIKVAQGLQTSDTL